VGLDERGEQSYDSLDYKMDCAVVLGAEGKGPSTTLVGTQVRFSSFDSHAGEGAVAKRLRRGQE